MQGAFWDERGPAEAVVVGERAEGETVRLVHVEDSKCPWIS